MTAEVITLSCVVAVLIIVLIGLLLYTCKKKNNSAASDLGSVPMTSYPGLDNKAYMSPQEGKQFQNA